MHAFRLASQASVSPTVFAFPLISYPGIIAGQAVRSAARVELDVLHWLLDGFSMHCRTLQL